jgi:hypothetical protein
VLDTRACVLQKTRDKGYKDGIIKLCADRSATLLDSEGKVRTSSRALHGGRCAVPCCAVLCRAVACCAVQC